MTYQTFYQSFLVLCITGIVSGLLSYILIKSLFHPFIGYWLESISLQSTILCAMLFPALLRLRLGSDATFLLFLVKMWLFVSAFNIIRTSINLLCVHAIFKRFSQYVKSNCESMKLSDFMIMFKKVYDSEMRPYAQAYRDIFFDLSYNLSRIIENL